MTEKVIFSLRKGTDIARYHQSEKRYALPFFFMVVKTNIVYQTVAVLSQRTKEKTEFKKHYR